MPRALRRRRPRAGDKWHLDEVFVKINGEGHYLWRAVDPDGNVLDILIQSRRDAKAARRFLRKLMKKQFLSVFSAISPHFRPRRHRLTAPQYRGQMTDRFTTWNEIIGLPAAA